MRRPSNGLVVLIILSLVLAACSTWIQSYYHQTYNTFAWDLGIFLQSLESFIFHGKLFYSTVELPYNPSGSYFGIHFSPILFLISVPYAIYPQPVTLFLIKNVFIYATAIVLYRIGLVKKLGTRTSFLIALSYLFYLPIYGALTYEFHPYSFFPFFLALTHLYVLKGHTLRAFTASILGMSTNEFSIILYAFYGLYLILWKKTIKIGKIILLSSLVWLGLAATVIYSFNNIQIRYYLQYFIWSKGPVSIATLPYLSDKVAFFTLAYGLLLFIPLTTPFEGVFLSIPWFIFAFMSPHLPYCSPYFQYGVFFTAQLFIAVIEKFSKIKRKTTRIASILLLLNLTAAIFLSPIGAGRLDYLTKFVRPTYLISPYRYDLSKIEPPNQRALDYALQIIPKNASIFVQNHIFPHLCKRFNVYTTFIPGKTGWPIIYEDLALVNITHVLLLPGSLGTHFLGEARKLIIRINGHEFISEKMSSIKFNCPPEKFSNLFLKISILPKTINVSQVILHSDPVHLGLAQGGHLVLILNGEHGRIIRFSNRPLNVGEWAEIEMNITRYKAVVKVNGEDVISLRIKHSLVAWLMDYVDYVILDSNSLTCNFRIGCLPIVLPPGYRLIAAGDGVMIFSRKTSPIKFINLTKNRYQMYIYPNDEPIGEPIMRIPLSEISWKHVVGPMAPQCILMDGMEVLKNIKVEGVEKFAFSSNVERVFSAKKINIRCSAIITGNFSISKSGIYQVKILHALPSIVDVYIDDELVGQSSVIYLDKGTHHIKVVWKKIRTPLLKVSLEKVS